jgi:hypothetical protein
MIAFADATDKRAPGVVDFAQDIFALGLPNIALRVGVARGQKGDDRIG